MTYKTKERQPISLVKDSNAYSTHASLTRNSSEAADPVWNTTDGTVLFNGVKYTLAEYILMRKNALTTGKCKKTKKNSRIFVMVRKAAAYFTLPDKRDVTAAVIFMMFIIFICIVLA